MSWLDLARLAKVPAAPKQQDDSERLIEAYLEQDRQLVAAGFPITSDWWLGEICRFVRTARTRWVARVGRRGGKSTTSARLVVCWALHGWWSVPPGDTAIVPFISVDRREAGGRIRGLEQILDALGIEYERRDGELEVREPRHVIFRVATCTVAGVVGFTSIAIVCDEVARWRNNATGANPAGDVVASLVPTMAGIEGAWIAMLSSPLWVNDFHAAQFERGEDELQQISWAPTWVARPNLTEEQTHRLEPDEAVWQREYGAEPSEGVEQWFGANAIEQSITADPPPDNPQARYTVSIDPAFDSDLFGYCVTASHLVAGRRVTWVHEIGAWDPRDAINTPGELARKACELAGKYRTTRILSDQYEGSSFGELCRQHGCYLEVIPMLGGMGPGSKTQKFRSVRLAMLDGSLKMPRDPELIRELGEVRGVFSDSGQERVEQERSEKGHGDRVSAMVTGVARVLELSPQAPAPEQDPPAGTKEYYDLEAKRMREQAVKEARKRQLEFSKKMRAG